MNFAACCRLCAALVVGAAVTLSAGAQEGAVQPERPDEGARNAAASLALADIRLGPFYLQPRVGIESLGWNSNVLGRNDASGRVVSDFLVAPLAGLRFLLPIRSQHVISGDAQTSYQWYSEEDTFRGFNTALEGRYEFDSERMEAQVSHRYTNAQSTDLQRTELDTGGTDINDEVLALIRRRINDTRGDLTFFLTRRTFIGGRGEQQVVRYDDSTPDAAAVARQLDRTEREFGGFLGMELRAGFRVRAFYDSRRFDYREPASIRDADTYRTGVEFVFDRANRLEGLVRVGYRDLTAAREDLLGYQGLIGNVQLRTILAGRTELTLRGDRDALPSLWGDNVFFLRQGGGVELVFQITRRFGLGGSVNYHAHTYSTETTLPQLDGSLLTATRSDDIYRYEGIFTWRLAGQEIRVRAGAYDRRSNYDTQNNSGLILTTGYVARF